MSALRKRFISADLLGALGNYIKNSGAAQGTQHWFTYQDAAQETPIDGEGGTSLLTLSRTTDAEEVLSSKASFKISKPAENTQGSGVGTIFEIDNAAKNKELQVAFDYYILGTFNHSVEVFIYDMLNEELIPLSNSVIENAQSPAVFISSFIASSSTQYKLLFHSIDTEASAFNLYFDTVTVGRKVLSESNVIQQYKTVMDGSFSEKHIEVLFDIGSGFNPQVYTLAIQPDGKLLAGGQINEFNGAARHRIVRLNPDGTEDTAFNTNLGTGFTGFSNHIRNITLQPDGKILVEGSFDGFNGAARNRLIRLNPDGTEDTAFYTNLGTGFMGQVNGIALQPDGKILAGGQFSQFNGNTRNRLIRLNPDGTEDTAFYTNLGTGFNTTTEQVFVDENGKILVGGQFSQFNGNTRNFFVRLNSDGTEDTAFNTNLGTGFTGSSRSVSQIKTQPDGKILVGGSFLSFNGNTRNCLVRLNPDGTEDTAFYTNLGAGFNTAIINTLALQPDGKILAGGSFTFNETRYRLIRLNPDGTEDTAFYTNLGAGFTVGINQIPRKIVLDEDGNIFLGGIFTQFNGNSRNGFLRLSTDGIDITEEAKVLKGLIFDNEIRVLVPGLSSEYNIIPTTQSPIELGSNEPGSNDLVAYVLPKFKAGPGDLSVSVSSIAALPKNATLIAARINDKLYTFVEEGFSKAWERGETGSRPSVPVAGQPFFDTTLGIPLWFDGTNWVDAEGTSR